MQINIQKDSNTQAKDIFGELVKYDQMKLFDFEIEYIRALFDEQKNLFTNPNYAFMTDQIGNASIIMARMTVYTIFAKVAFYGMDLMETHILNKGGSNIRFASIVNSVYGTIDIFNIDNYISGRINRFNAHNLAVAMAHSFLWYSKWDEQTRRSTRVYLTLEELCANINAIHQFLQSMISFGLLCYKAMSPDYKADYTISDEFPAVIPSNSNYTADPYHILPSPIYYE